MGFRFDPRHGSPEPRPLIKEPPARTRPIRANAGMRRGAAGADAGKAAAAAAAAPSFVKFNDELGWNNKDTTAFEGELFYQSFQKGLYRVPDEPAWVDPDPQPPTHQARPGPAAAAGLRRASLTPAPQQPPPEGRGAGAGVKEEEGGLRGSEEAAAAPELGLEGSGSPLPAGLEALAGLAAAASAAREDEPGPAPLLPEALLAAAAVASSSETYKPRFEARYTKPQKYFTVDQLREVVRLAATLGSLDPPWVFRSLATRVGKLPRPVQWNSYLSKSSELETIC